MNEKLEDDLVHVGRDETREQLQRRGALSVFNPSDAEQSPSQDSPPVGLREMKGDGRAWGPWPLNRPLTDIQIQKKESPLETLWDPRQPQHFRILLTLHLGHPGAFRIIAYTLPLFLVYAT